MAVEFEAANTLIAFIFGGGGLTLIAKGIKEILHVYREEKKDDRVERKEIRDADRAEERERHMREIQDRKEEREARERGMDLARQERAAEREVRNHEIKSIESLNNNLSHAIERIDALIMEVRSQRMTSLPQPVRQPPQGLRTRPPPPPPGDNPR